MANYNSVFTGAQIDAGVSLGLASVQDADIVNFETTTQLNSRDTANRNRANHTGTQLASTISDFNSAVDARVVPGGLDTQIQFNDGGAFTGDSALTWNKTADELTVGGDVILDDGVAGFETIVQCVPPTADRVISFPDATGVVALTSQVDVKVSSVVTGVTGADVITNMMSLTQAEYDALTGADAPDASTFYVIVG